MSNQAHDLYLQKTAEMMALDKRMHGLPYGDAYRNAQAAYVRRRDEVDDLRRQNPKLHTPNY